MALTERQVIGQMTVLEDGQIQVRTDTVIERDGVEVSRTFHRHVVAPGMVKDTDDAKLKEVAAAVHTLEVVAAYQAKRDAQIAAETRSE